jgi:uncharacterized protein (DUF362 family)/Pyruvate/2-oxoacid:ferredoxin oxidoreductase delta subunit
MEQVALIECPSYDVDLLEQKLREGFRLLGGEPFLHRLIPAGSSVLLKPNLLSVESPGSPVVTHHAVFEAVVRIVRDYSEKLSFGDSPGFGDSRRAAEKAGLLEVAGRYGVKFEDFKESLHIKCEDALLCKSWEIARAPYEADVLISLPKLKTHGMAFMTGAIKNQFGCVPGLQKPAWHTRMSDPHHFSRMLLDLNTVVGTSFAVLDGITAMDGNGPKNGSPFQLQALIMGQSLSAVDSVAARLIGYSNPLDVPALKEVHENRWGAVLPQEIEVLGESIDRLKAASFKLVRSSPGSADRFFTLLAPLLRGAMVPDPVLRQDKCIGCRRCFDVCPEKPKVISMVDQGGKSIPRWNLDYCIRCFCCQELCPEGAIELRYRGIGSLLHRSQRARR